MPTAQYAGGAQRIAPMAPATPEWRPPTTVNATSSGVNWDAIGSAFTSALWGGQNFASTKGNPTSYFTSTPSYMKDYIESVRSSVQGSASAQQQLSEQNARAFQALVAAGSQSGNILNSKMPIVVDPRNPVFQLNLPQPGQQPTGGSNKTMFGIAALAAAFIVWRKMKKGGGASRPMRRGDDE